MTLIRQVQASAPPATRFERQMLAGNWINDLAQIRLTTNRIVRTIRYVSSSERARGYHGLAKRGDMYQIGVSFALENVGVYSEPLPSAEGNRLYQIRMALAQYQAFPLIMGWSLDWYLPEGWVWWDGLGTRTHEEFISNPMVVTRMVQSPGNPAPAGFQIVVGAKYQ